MIFVLLFSLTFEASTDSSPNYYYVILFIFKEQKHFLLSICPTLISGKCTNFLNVTNCFFWIVDCASDGEFRKEKMGVYMGFVFFDGILLFCPVWSWICYSILLKIWLMLLLLKLIMSYRIIVERLIMPWIYLPRRV